MKANTYIIPKENLLYLNQKLAKINKKAIKLGIEPITYKITREFSQQTRDEHSLLKPEKWYFEIEIINDKPVHLPGWELVAVITPVSNEKLLKIVPDKTVPDTYRNVSMVCEHCNKARHRKDTFVMHNTETNEYKQIGRQCIQDFLGGDPTGIFNRATWVNEIKTTMEDACEDRIHHGRKERCWSMEEILNLACAIIRKTGYWSMKAIQNMEAEDNSGKSSTYSDTLWLLCPDWNTKDREAKDKYIEKWGIEVQEQDINQAKQVISWAQQIPTDVKNSYLYNIGVAARSNVATDQTAALLISAIEAYRKEIEKITYEKKEKKESNWIGQPNDRIIIQNVKQVNRYVMEGDYGICSCIKFVQEETGNVFIWWASGNVDFASDEPLTIKATVKAHEEYKGTKQTVILRVKEVNQ